MKRRSEALIRFTPAADYSAKEGYGVTIAGDTATLSASGTVPIEGVIVEGGTVADGVTVAIPGACAGTFDVKLGGTVTRGDMVTQHTDGTFITDAGSGARVIVGVANESGVAGDLIEVALRTPVSAS